MDGFGTERLQRAARALTDWITTFRASDVNVARREPPASPLGWRGAMRSRLVVCALGFALWTAAVEARLVYLQVISRAEWQDRANRQQLDTVKLSAKRGEITDRNGRLLAYSVDADTITANPRQVEDPETTAQLICDALDTCNAELRELMTLRLKSNRQWVYLARRISPPAAQRVRELDLQGVGLYSESRRYYPNRQLAAHVLGYVGLENEGLGGIESRYNDRIRGKEGRLLVKSDARQRALAVHQEEPATAGASLELTIDRNLQHIAERELEAGIKANGAASGTAIIMDPSNGDVLALANWPTFNPNAFTSADEKTRRNRAVQEIYEPGSTFKIVTASAAIEEGVLSPEDPIDCSPGWIKFPGRPPIRDVHSYGVLSFTDVIVKSSNVGAIKAGLALGPERLVRYMARFGFGQRLAPDFSGESPGIVWRPEKLDASALASVSMGYQVGVTPLQMAAAVSAVANGGTLYEPRIVRAIVRDGQREERDPKPLRRAIAPETAATLTTIMEEVVNRGTAKTAQIPGYSIAGKTGTARKVVNKEYSKTDYYASFVGFVPSRRPELAIIVVFDSPRRGAGTYYYGGVAAAPVFKRIAEASLRHLGVPPNLNPPPAVIVASNPPDESDGQAVLAPARLDGSVDLTIEDGVMPDLIGLSAREALRALTRAGLTARLDGDGFVIDQQPAAGTPALPGAMTRLRLGRRMPAASAGGDLR